MATLIIEGKEYPMPDLADLTMGQARIIKRYTGLALDGVGETSAANPDLIAAYCHLAILADNPTRGFSDIERQVDAIRFVKLDFKDDEVEEEAAPLAPSEPPESSDGGPSSGPTSAESSGNHQETIPPRIGMRA